MHSDYVLSDQLIGTYLAHIGRVCYFIELWLPFGLHSSVFIFNSFANALEWILRNKYGLEFLSHYLDDFITADPANSAQCKSNLATIQQVFNRLGVPLAPDKLESPTTVLTYLGIVY